MPQLALKVAVQPYQITISSLFSSCHDSSVNERSRLAFQEAGGFVTANESCPRVVIAKPRILESMSPATSPFRGRPNLYLFNVSARYYWAVALRAEQAKPGYVTLPTSVARVRVRRTGIAEWLAHSWSNAGTHLWLSRTGALSETTFMGHSGNPEPLHGE
jgi:hypothetical protein